MKKALLNIDYTYDFVATEGKLTCGEPGQVLHDYILNLTKEFVEQDDYVVFPIDLHYENDPYHPETQLFPPHNIDGTKGRLLYGDLEAYYQSVKNREKVYYFDKQSNFPFEGTNLGLRFSKRNMKESILWG